MLSSLVLSIGQTAVLTAEDVNSRGRIDQVRNHILQFSGASFCQRDQSIVGLVTRRLTMSWSPLERILMDLGTTYGAGDPTITAVQPYYPPGVYRF